MFKYKRYNKSTSSLYVVLLPVFFSARCAQYILHQYKSNRYVLYRYHHCCGVPIGLLVVCILYHLLVVLKVVKLRMMNMVYHQVRDLHKLIVPRSSVQQYGRESNPFTTAIVVWGQDVKN